MNLYEDGRACACGKVHTCALERVIVGKGVLAQLPREIVRLCPSRTFVLCDVNTYEAAGKRVEALLEQSGIAYALFVFPDAHLEPDEHAVRTARQHLAPSCHDLVLAVGSGVIGDIAKLLAAESGAEYMIVATAPSMDGYASATSSMTVNGLKVSLPSKCAHTVIGDTDILKNAPMEMLISGLGDMLAKYISIAEWRISAVVTGEYYCEAIAAQVRDALGECVKQAEGLLRREDAAVEAVFRGLVFTGAAMAYAGASRPASGIEHYFSHIWDMRGVAFGTPVSTHGIQCAVGTLLAAGLYEQMLTVKPDVDRGRAYVQSFDKQAWFAQLRTLIGKGAEDMIALEQKEQKYDCGKHAWRVERIVAHWEQITDIIRAEIPTSAELYALLERIGCPVSPESWGGSTRELAVIFKATKDIRDKYILSRLAFDLGVIDEMAATLQERSKT